jgi:hypothetical protein
MRAAEILTIRTVAGPLLDLGTRIEIPMDVLGSSSNDAIGLIERDN